jgi:site-specific DNA-cytosine methylase
MSDLREYFQQKEIQERLRSGYSIHEPENVLTVLRELERRGNDSGIPMPGSEVSKDELRTVRNDSRSRRPSQGREHQEQQPGQYPDALPLLPHEIALATKSLIQQWQNETNTNHRVHRLKALGNSIVPQIALEIFKAIEEAS